MPESIERREVIFQGRVQGVGFRATTRAIAQGFEVCGWVRNESDGTVRMEAQGTSVELDLFVAALRARFSGFIEGLDARAVPPCPEIGFEVRR